MCSKERLTTREIGGECGEILKKYFVNAHRRGYFTIEGVCMPDHYTEVGRKILDFRVRDDDVWVCSFPKTGTTWCQEMVWCIANDLDYASSKEVLMKRFPFLDLPGIFIMDQQDNGDDSDGGDYIVDPITYLDKMDSPRFIKTHLPFHLAPLQLQDPHSKAKMVVISRNPKDTCVSYFHHCVNFEGYTGNFEDFAKLFLEDSVTYAPFDKNVLSYWELRDNPRVLFLKYEDMKKDLPGVIRRVSDFLGKSYTDEQVAGLAEHLSFDNMKKNLMIAKSETGDIPTFWRKGQIGSWKESMDEELVERFRVWTEARFSGTGLEWEYN